MNHNLKFINERDLSKLTKLYQRNDRAHRIEHVITVAHSAQELCKKVRNKSKYQYTRVTELACLLHDIGCYRGREEHQNHSRDIILEMKDDSIFEGLDIIEIELIAKAAVEHRASYKGEYSSPTSEIVSSADRGAPCSDFKDFLERRVKRSMQYHLDNNKGATIEEAYNHAREHLKEKYGVDGYARYADFYKEVYKNELMLEYANIEKLYNNSLSTSELGMLHKLFKSLKR